MSVRILLADDHALVRAGIRALVEDVEGVSVVGEAASGFEAVELARTHRPDLVLMDISMSDMNGVEATTAVRDEVPCARVIIVSMHDSAEMACRAFRAGAAGYVLKTSAPGELAMAIDAVLRGEMYTSAKVSWSLILAATGLRGAESRLDELSPRQRHVLQLLAEGNSAKEIAYRLDVSVKTVDTHRAVMKERLGIRSIAGLVRFAIRHRLVDGES
jgi:DNA-binding NarL/FixJ family response regulator